MTLGFKTEIKGTPTYFVEKIWERLQHIVTQEAFDRYFFDCCSNGHYQCLNKAPTPKIHTIRKDEKTVGRLEMIFIL